MSNGKPVVVLFLIIIVVCVGGFFIQLRKDNDRLYNIAVKQEEVIGELRAANKSLRVLNQLMMNRYYSPITLPVLPEKETKTDPI